MPQANSALADPVGTSPLHGLAFVGAFVAALFLPAWRPWPLFWLGPLVLYGLLVWAVPPLRTSFHLWTFGRGRKWSSLATLLIGLISCLGLLSFQWILRPDLNSYLQEIPFSQAGQRMGMAFLFPPLNALCEEVVFQGILFDAFAAQWKPCVALLVTAVLFGCSHLHGYPPGAWGAILAGIFGLSLGWLRLYSRGLGRPILAHLAADATIYTIITKLA